MVGHPEIKSRNLFMLNCSREFEGFAICIYVCGLTVLYTALLLKLIIKRNQLIYR